jgi:hypothetical protein
MTQMRKIGPLLQQGANLMRGEKVAHNMLRSTNLFVETNESTLLPFTQNPDSDFIRSTLHSCFQDCNVVPSHFSFLLFSKLRNLSYTTLAHLKKEDKIFFPLLGKTSLKNPYIQNREMRIQNLKNDLEEEHLLLQNLIDEIMTLLPQDHCCGLAYLPEGHFSEKFLLFAKAIERHINGQKMNFAPQVLKKYPKNFVKGERDVYKD